jgi:putative membrane-bound dehydrogenase-like protein
VTLNPAVRAQFPEPRDTEKNPGALMPSEEAARKWDLPKGIRAEVFAAEPEVRNPIAMAWDAKGRLWVAENFTYAEQPVRMDAGHRDRVLVFDPSKDRGEKGWRTVFMDGLQGLSSIEVGKGGVWLLCPPHLWFVPDPDADGVPDGAPQAVLDGFTVAQSNHHNFANGLRWGPDGWLYGRCGASCPGEVGAPGTPPERRVPVRGGVWRYHTERRVFEALCHGTTNPWGHDWDDLGELFFVNTVNGHLWHGIPGAHYARPHTQDPNPHAYVAVDQHADHYHFDTGKSWTASRDGAANALGGGHAHSGAMFYLADQWPEAYRGLLFTLNFHGRRMNLERIERQGAGYVGKHEMDLGVAADSWFRGVDLSTGPDGSVYVLDWSDTGECHESTGVHRQSGRIYRLSAEGAARPKSVDLNRLGELSLVSQHRNPNAWIARKSIQVMRDRWLRGVPMTESIRSLRDGIDWEGAPALRLRRLWALWELNALSEKELSGRLRDWDEHMRAWVIRLLTDKLPLDTVMGKRPEGEVGLNPAVLSELSRVAWNDTSGLVHLTLASVLCRLPLAQRAELAVPLLATEQWATDPNFPAMVWYGLQPLAETDARLVAELTAGSRLPLTTQCVSRFLAERMEADARPLDTLLDAVLAGSEELAMDVFLGMQKGVAGWRKAPQPRVWPELMKRFGSEEKFAEVMRSLSVVFGAGRAVSAVREVVLDGKAEVAVRRKALQTLAEADAPDLRQVAEKVLGHPGLAGEAARVLARFPDPSIGKQLVKRMEGLPVLARQPLIETLVTRPAWARELLDAIGAGKFQRSELSASGARQIAALKEEGLRERLKQVWGEVRLSTGARAQWVAQWKQKLVGQNAMSGQVAQGRAVFASVCASCHRMYGEGGALGPDLTGSDRRNLDYLLENIGDPSAVVAPEYRFHTLTLKDGRILVGMLGNQTPKTVELKGAGGTLVLERAEIRTDEESSQSMMPEGLLEGLNERQVADLFAFLRSEAAP